MDISTVARIFKVSPRLQFRLLYYGTSLVMFSVYSLNFPYTRIQCRVGDERLGSGWSTPPLVVMEAEVSGGVARSTLARAITGQGGSIFIRKID
jgi:hypothetical protein